MNDVVRFIFKPNKSKVDAFFDRDDGLIYIHKNFGKILTEITYAHEVQHKKCLANKCFCWEQDSDYWSEYHAFKAMFYFVVSKHSKRYWRIFFDAVISDLIKYNNNEYRVKSYKEHFNALKKVCKLKLFIEYAKQYNYWNDIKRIINGN